MVKSKNRLMQVIALSLLLANCLILEHGYESSATKFTKRLSTLFSVSPTSKSSNKVYNVDIIEPTRMGSIHFPAYESNILPPVRSVDRNKFRNENNKFIYKNERGFDVLTYSGVKLNTVKEIKNRDLVLKDIREHVETNEAHNFARSLFYELLNYEPNSSKRSDFDMSRVYKHISTDRQIQVKVHVNEDGDFSKVVLKSNGRKHTFEPEISDYKVEVIKESPNKRLKQNKVNVVFHKYSKERLI